MRFACYDPLAASSAAAVAGAIPAGVVHVGQGRLLELREALDRAALAVERARSRVVALILGNNAAVLAVGFAIFLGYLVSPPPSRRWDFPDRLAEVGAMIKGGGILGDLGQDVVGLRRLWEHRDPYPVLGPALREIGVSWDLHHASTHPPTAFLFAAPVSYLGLPAAARVWAAICFALLFISLRAFSVPRTAALGLALGLPAIWGPVASSFHQLTLVWLVAIALAYRWRSRAPFAAGAALGVASLTKLLPLVMLGHFVFRRKVRALAGAAAVCVIGCACVLLLEPSAFARYVEVNRENSWATALRSDNVSVLFQTRYLLGKTGLALALLCLALLVWVNRRALLAPRETSDYSFFLYSFLAVLLLPICWGPSLVPLLPVIGYFLVEGRAAHVVLAAAAFIDLAVCSPFGSAPVLTVAVILVGALFFIPPPEQRAVPRRD